MYFVTFILKNLTRRPTRTALTVLGLSVAVGSTIALLGVSDNFTTAAAVSFRARGVDLVVIQNVQINDAGKIEESILEQVRRLDKVRVVSAAIVNTTTLREPDGTTIPAMVQAWPPENTAYDALQILDGRRLTAEDEGHPRVMLGRTLAANFRPHKRVGDTVMVGDVPHEVVGVFKSFTVYENGSLIISLRGWQKLMFEEGRITGFSVRVQKGENPEADVEQVRQAILALKTSDGRALPVFADTPENYVQEATHLRLTRAIAWSVSALALLIGVIGMLNTMAMSVLERTQEIGILRAVGWTRRRVIRMILGEALVLGLVAAVIGSVGAVALTHLLAQSPQVNGFVEGGIAPGVILKGFVITGLIGLLGGAFPAYRASRLLPTEAIRHD